MASHFEPLLGKRHIRFLVLADDAIRPGRTLRCKFEECHLDRILPWDTHNALSYVWGSSPERIQISCEDHPAHITTNLYNALIQIWTMTPRKRLWADALCINQGDDTEKGHQVGMMGDIYRHAGAFIIWFGKADKQILRLWDSIWGNEPHDEWQDEQHREQHHEQHANADDLDHFLRNASFFRAWTVQEILLAPKAVALCGLRWIEWSRLTKGSPTNDPMEQLCLYSQIMRKTTQEWDEPSPLTNMILATSNRESRDPQDRIHALLGLLPDDVLGTSPSYEITLTDLYEIVLDSIYIKHDDLRLLHCCGSGWHE